MRNIFLLYMPPRNMEAQVHYADTIKNGVSLDRISRYVSADLRSTLKNIFGNKPITVWGSRNSEKNRPKFDQMAIGDEMLIVDGSKIRLLGIVAAKVFNPELSRELWKNLRGETSEGWDLIYFIANAREINIEFAELRRLFGYKENFGLRGLTQIAQARLEAFDQQYGDLYDVLIRLRDGDVLRERSADTLRSPDEESGALREQDDLEQMLPPEIISDHVRMQWKLSHLGQKAGQSVWVPPGDQTRIRKHYENMQFEAQLTTGIDLPSRYFENIDVIWKEQFRIDAAFEIENSTAIYSGLLRFSDLSLVAPNTIYPLFIVAPAARREEVRSQLKRPTFERLKLIDRVKFLPYEAVDEIERFYQDTTTGPTVDVIADKAQRLV